MARFEENFWGEKHGGYDVLYQNMKHGEQTSKDWAEFLRQYASAEEQYCKSLQRLAKSAGSYMAVGSFASVWPVVKASFDKLAQAHQDLSKQWQDMAKDIAKYGEGQVKKHKTVKDAQTPTVEVVQAMQHASGALQKSKEAYQFRFAEFCKARKDHASVKKADKMDADFKKTAEDYKTAVSRYNSARDEFEAKLTDSCKAFQEQEEAHLTQMLTFLKSFAAAHEQKHVEIGEMYYDLHSNVEQFSVAKMLQDFVDGKRTGVDRPAAAEFEEVDMSLLPPPDDAESKKDGDSAAVGGGGAQSGGGSSTAAATMHIIIPGILKKRRGKKLKQQQQQSRGSAANGGDSKDSDSLDTQSKNSQPEVDDDGYIIRKDEAPKEEDSWDSDSDSGGSDGERSRTKIKVEIKPIDRSSGGSNVGGSAEIKLPPRLSSTQLAGAGLGSRGSKLADGGAAGSGGGSAGTGSESSSSASAWDLLGLDLHPSVSMPVTPDSIGGMSSLSGSSGIGGTPSANSSVFGSAHQSAQAGADGGSTEDREVERLWQSPIERRGAHEQAAAASAAPPLPAAIPGLPRPPSRRDFTGTSSGRQAPGRSSPMLLAQQQRSDFLAGGGGSSSSLSGGSPFASSRGPSPMCGISASVGSASVSPSGESMPIAVALTEVVDACLTSAAASGQGRPAAAATRVAGDVIISLPLTVAKRVAEGSEGVQQTSSPLPPLLFKLVRVGRLEQWQVNDQLIVSTPVEREGDTVAYAFSMPALVEHLRSRLAESRTATYFNIDVVKYVVKPREPDTLPLQARACWRCEPGRVDLLLEYAYNAAGLACPRPLAGLSFLVPVPGDVIGMQSVPEGQWSHEHRKALWKVDELSPAAAGQSGSGARTVRARFELGAGDGASSGTAAAAVAAAGSPVAVQFACDDATVSGIDFELVGTGYRLSLTKRRMRTGKFSVVGEVRQAEIRYV